VSLTHVLAAQEDEAGAADDRAARRHGQEMLDELAGLQRDLLGDGLGLDRLRRLVALTDTTPRAANPRLREVVAAVALRARVEIARFDGASVPTFE
jgi:hypothetical protein